MLQLKAPGLDPLAIGFGPGVLRPHQEETAAFIRGRRGTLLASEQRTGKTPSVMYAHEPEAGPMLVVGPVAARAVWHEWAVRRFGGMCGGGRCAICARLFEQGLVSQGALAPSFLALDGRTFRPEMLEGAQPRVLFCTFAVVSTWRELSMSMLAQMKLMRLGTLCVDEAHLGGMQNRKSLTFESLRWLNSIADRVICATGTPLFNKVAGFWPLLDLCAPTAFGDFWSFARRYCDARPTDHGWRADGSSNEIELRARLTEIMFRKRWTDIATNLPPITRSVETVALKQKVRDEIDELAARLRYEAGSSKTQVGILARLRKLYAEAKLDPGIASTLSTVLDGHSVIVWAWHIDVAERLVEKLRAKGIAVYGPVTGKVIGGAREEMLDKARDHEGPRVLVANIAALGFAVDLSWASHEIFVELDWSPPTIAQAEMRPYNGKQPVSATYLVADCDSDESLVEALIAKLEKQDQLGLRAGVGDVADVLQRTFKLEGKSLSKLAEQLMENAEGEV